ncbi:prophage tail fiber N-terminal domain-containing protein [Escherichia coli]|uniref:prophage tail fiber N-terminal domain-containing protein n=1 Tax=Escherichia coli TaxID=562 RepID=UPI00259D0A3B|nr:prophage tail fiber N-terminal domain-containing protein [Escherichia coli]MDM4965363.1 prophage tail fiber N-terminal domain-containing protein [Escherichia coli]MDM4966218.1 prophage tail fiber N-terminal domain-containing protein [Escherichia coli]MDM4966972.1 prophage tail fiber N-terminal domain-containing protein [Escherichia coli]MDM4967393.1 prophage tail fiber N-terminal domain-containing protein [Escherichia coli]MDM4968104.1 prophage tail fiber N-terminal domain-containing protei
MSVLISGALINGAGVPMAECKIYLDALVNTSEVVTESFAVIETDAAGQYAFEAQKGKYTVHIKQKNGPKCCVGDISVYDDSKPGTLNDFLTALDEGDLKPDVVKRFEEMVAQAQQSAEAAAESEQQAGQHAEAASLIKEQVGTLADNVQQNAEAVAASKQRVEQLASQVEDTAEEVRRDAEAAKKAASDAEQARDDIDVALSATLKTANHLSEIAAEGEDAQQESRDNLGLKSAALLDVQSDIYDRTAGCLALPGAFGYGHVFSSSEVVYFSAQNGPAEFLKWVFEVTPGRYAVTQYGGTNTSYNPIIAYDMGQPYFRGLVDIDIRYGIDSGGIEAEARRWITFHGDAEYSGGFGEGPAKYQVLVKKSMRPSDLPEAWSRLFWSRKRLMQLLYATENTSKRPPFPGGLVLAAYLPDDGSSEVTLLRAQGVSGSRLRQVVFEAEYRTSGISAAARSFVYGDTLPGTYVALSGGPDVKFYSRGVVSLFVRVA